MQQLDKYCDYPGQEILSKGKVLEANEDSLKRLLAGIAMMPLIKQISLAFICIVLAVVVRAETPDPGAQPGLDAHIPVQKQPEAADRGDASLPLPEEADCRVFPKNPLTLDLDEIDEEGRPDFITLPEGTTIGEIRVYAQDIFPELERTDQPWYERITNRLHPVTKKRAIKAQLLFREGDVYEPFELSESARLLRRSPYLFNAAVFPVRLCGNVVDVAVVTRDLWTFIPNLNFSHAGGESKSEIGFTDDNFLGWGKRLSISREEDEERTEYALEIFDPNLFGSRWQGELELSDNSDGERQQIGLAYPFYRVGAPWSVAVEAGHEIRDDSLYFRNEVIEKFRHTEDYFNIYVGVSTFFNGNHEQRMFVGFSYLLDQFEVDEETVGPLPDDRELNYPWIAYEWRDNIYLKAFNINQLQRVEDVPLGWRSRIKIGWSDDHWGGTTDQLIVNSDNRYRWGTARVVSTLEFDFGMRWDSTRNRSEDVIATLSANSIRMNEKRSRSWYAEFEYTATHNLTREKQVLLGGKSGLRGYPSNYQAGNQSAVFSLERRFYWKWYPLKTFRTAGVIFFDIGRAWFDDQHNGANGQFLKDVGVGLRITSSRIQVTRVLHADLAFPLDRNDEDIDSVQFVLRGQQSF